MNECKSGKKEKSTKKLLKYVTHIIKKNEKYRLKISIVIINVNRSNSSAKSLIVQLKR